MSAGAVLLQVLDDANLRLQSGLLSFETVNFLLDLLQAGFFGFEGGDVRVGVVQLALLLE